MGFIKPNNPIKKMTLVLPRPPQSKLLGPFRWVFSHGRTYLTDPPPWRFLQEAPHLSLVLRRRCLAEVYIIFWSLCKHFNYLYFTPFLYCMVSMYNESYLKHL